MKTIGKVALDRRKNKYFTTKYFDDVEIYDVWLDPSDTPEWPGNWWGKCQLEGKEWELVATQTYSEKDGVLKNNDRRTWRNSKRLSHNKKIELQIDEYDMARYLEKDGKLPSKINIRELKEEILKKCNALIRYDYEGLYEFSESGDLDV